jgi:hypothetical protein
MDATNGPADGDARAPSARGLSRPIRLHVVGCPRSGTTLMAEMLATSFAGVGHDEHELSIFKRPPGAHALYVSKKPADVKRIGPLLRADPHLFVIGVHRDPRAVITSIIAGDERYRISYRAWAQCMRAARELAGHPRFLDVRYERLVAEPDAVQAEIERRFPFLVRRHPFSEFAQHARPTKEALGALGGVRAPDARGSERWRAHLPRVKAELLRHPEMAQALIDLGYERDAAWTAELAHVTPHPQKRKAAFREFFEDLDASVRYGMKQRRYLRRLAREAGAGAGGTAAPVADAGSDRAAAGVPPARTA